jgi:hypothetical protein
VKNAADQLGDDVVGHGEEILVGRASLGRISHARWSV